MFSSFDAALARTSRPIALTNLRLSLFFSLSFSLSLSFSVSCSLSDLSVSGETTETCASSLFQSVRYSSKVKEYNAPSQLSALTPGVPNAIIAPHSSAPADYLEASVPLAWTHIPKCGTSLMNSLVRLPGVCPGLPVGDTVLEWHGEPFESVFPGWEERCPGLTSPFVVHRNVGSSFEDVYHNHGVIMLRQPEQRLISMYNHAINIKVVDVPKSPAGRTDPIQTARLIDMYNMTLLDFADSFKACAVRMMTKDGSGWKGCLGIDDHFQFTAALDVSVADISVAQKRLRGYAFVGITDYWAESICLLHAMFGGECHPAEFADVRNRSNSTTSYDTNELQGFVDEYDGALYKEALSIFTENTQRYSVSQKSCQQCFQSGGLSASQQEEMFRAELFGVAVEA